MTARPFLKWAGGKGQLLAQLLGVVPGKRERYFEPFLGGGALFFELAPVKSTLSDLNAEIVECYVAVRDRVEDVIGALLTHHYDAAHYYEVRKTDPRALPLAERAARTIFLNKTGFNGLYRVNRSGQFNVPFGRFAKPPRICDEDNLRACSAALANAELLVSDFEKVAERAGAGDFVYFDPPYVPLSRTSAFTSYVAAGFDLDAHRRLAEVFSRLAGAGTHVVLSNSDVPEIRELYAAHRIEHVKAARAINSKGSKRGPVSELLVCNRVAAARRPRAAR